MSNDKNNLVYREQLDDNVIEMLSEDIGSNYSLRTENSKTIVAALNEILGKDIICNAVGSPLLTTDTFAELGEKIHVMVNDFKAKLLGLGVSVSSVDKLASLIEKIGEIDLGVDAEELLNPYIESLREILEEHSIELNGEGGLTELIIKVDEILLEKDMMINSLNYTKNEWYELLKLAGYDVNYSDDMSVFYQKLKASCLAEQNVKKIVCGKNNTYILKNDNTIWACGANGSGQLGLDDTDINTPIFIQMETNVLDCICGGGRIFIIKNDVSLWACGNNSSGQ